MREDPHQSAAQTTSPKGSQMGTPVCEVAHDGVAIRHKTKKAAMTSHGPTFMQIEAS